MTDCDKCGQPLPKSPMILDALGREVPFQAVLLWLKPVTNISGGGLTVTLAKPVYFEGVVLYQVRVRANPTAGDYDISACPPYGRTVQITGKLGEPNPRLYKIANNVTEL